MRAKKYIVFITLSITVLSLIIVLCLCNTESKLYDISLALLGSAFLGFIMTLVEYFSERKNSMERFLIEANKLANKLLQIQYLSIDEPTELVIDCLAEEQSNRFVFSHSEEVSQELKLKPSYKSRDKYISHMKEHRALSIPENADISLFIEAYNDEMEKYKKHINECIDKYLEFSKIDLENLSYAYRAFDFIFGNKSVRDHAYNKIYVPIKNFTDEIKNEADNLKLIKEGKGNYAICIDKLLEFNNTMFTVEKIQRYDIEITDVYSMFNTDIRNALNYFLSKIYLNKNNKYIEEKVQLVFSKLRTIKTNSTETNV